MEPKSFITTCVIIFALPGLAPLRLPNGRLAAATPPAVPPNARRAVAVFSNYFPNFPPIFPGRRNFGQSASVSENQRFKQNVSKFPKLPLGSWSPSLSVGPRPQYYLRSLALYQLIAFWSLEKGNALKYYLPMP